MRQHIRILTHACAVGALATASFAQNDECASASVLPLGTTAFDTSNATLSMEPWTCASSSAPDLWFVYTAASSNPITFDTCGSSYDTALQVLQGPCGTQTPVACNDDVCGAQSSITIPGGMVGDVIYVRVGGYLGETGAGVLNVSEVPPSGIPNDDCQGAIAIGVGATPFDTTGALTSLPEWSCASGGADIWYSYTTTSSSTVRFATCGSSYDTALEVFSGTCGALTSIACDDDSCGLQSTVFARPGAPGDVFFLRVGGYAGNAGLGTLVVSEYTASNDDCASATPLLAGASTVFDTSGAAPFAIAFSCGSGAIGGDLWFSYTPTSSSVALRVETCGSAIDTILEAYEGPCGALVSLDCSVDFCSSYTAGTGFMLVGGSRVNVTSVTAGQTYYFRVAGENGSSGQGIIVLDEVPPPVQGCVLNPGFETGDLAGWSFTEGLARQPALVAPAGMSFGLTAGLFISAPTEGSYSMTHSFSGFAPGVKVLSQVVAVNNGLTPLTFDWRAGWDFQNWGPAMADRTFDVVVRDPMTGAMLQSTRIMTALVGTVVLDTGSTPGAVDLSTFIGQTVRVSFEWTVGSGGLAFFEIDNVSCQFSGGPIGTNYCATNANSTGATASMSASGSPVVSVNTLTLIASDVPPYAFGFFLASAMQGFVANPGGSAGNLCLGGGIGRYVGPGQIQNSGASGELMVALDLTSTPQPTGFVAISPGETWNFTAWYRDSVAGTATSNFTDGLSIDFF
ncbi:MAG: hypothetical protein ACJA2W_002926 [Planctomycetota bacterium]|jgi:hypothetical protein